jgi:hypothetical protein
MIDIIIKGVLTVKINFLVKKKHCFNVVRPQFFGCVTGQIQSDKSLGMTALGAISVYHMQ